MRQDILVPIDRSKASEKALEFALEEYREARIYAVHVTATNDPLGLFRRKDPAEYMVPECGSKHDAAMVPREDMFTRAQRRRAERILNRACAKANSYERDIEPLVRSGNVVDEIVDCARQRDIDRIVITEHGRTELRPFRRSVPEEIALNCDIPVTIIG